MVPVSLPVINIINTMHNLLLGGASLRYSDWRLAAGQDQWFSHSYFIGRRITTVVVK